MLETALEEAPKPQKNSKSQKNDEAAANTMPPTSHTFMDLIITIAVYLPRSSFAPLFNLAARILPLQTDAQLQKKAYKLIPRLAKSPTGKGALRDQSAELQRLMLENSQSASLPARRDRLLALAGIIDNLPDNDLHFIPSVLSEVVLACKDHNEKARNAGFDLLITMAQRMSEGGTVHQSKIPHMDPHAPDANANLEEFFTMIAAGLVGNTPHMISATITALTRVLYHFIDKLPHPVLEDLLQTIAVFLTSNDREIVRAVLGFAKVALLSLPEDIIKPRLDALIPGIFSWAHEHKARFRSKIKNILERAIRRFGFEMIEQYAPDEDKKLLAHIRKTRERRKKKKKSHDADGDDDSVAGGGAAPTNGTSKPRFESEYDEALYGSDDSSISSQASDADSGDDVAASSRTRRKGQGRRGGNEAYITETVDEPLDLLDRKSIAHVSSSRPQAARKVPLGRNRGETDLDGKLIFKEKGQAAVGKGKASRRGQNGDREDDGDAMEIDAAGDSVNAYVEAVSGRDAVQRGQRGRLKFDTRRKRGEDMEMDDDGEDAGGVFAGASMGPARSNGAGPKKVRFAPKAGKSGSSAGAGEQRAGKGRTVPAAGGKGFQARRGGMGKRVQRKPLGGGKVSGGRVEKGGVRM